jgi:hypothetical protein
MKFLNEISEMKFNGNNRFEPIFRAKKKQGFKVSFLFSLVNFKLY